MIEPSVDVGQLNRLRSPFPPEAVGKLPRIVCTSCRKGECKDHKRGKCRTCGAYIGKHIHLDYVGHAHVRERLLNVDPAWSWEPLAFDDHGLPALDSGGGMWIRLTVCGVTRLGYGDAPGKKGGDAVKEVIGDALRNAALSFGVAIDLWKKEPAPVQEDEPSRQVERAPASPEQRRTDLRGEIAKFGRNKGRKIEEIADDFVAWSQGTAINQADAAMLEDYLAHITTQESGGGS